MAFGQILKELFRLKSPWVEFAFPNPPPPILSVSVASRKEKKKANLNKSDKVILKDLI